MEAAALPHIRCSKCGHESVPRVAKPVKCPRCGAPYQYEEKKK